MKTFEVEVRQTVKITLDETKFDDVFMLEFRQHFFRFYDLEDHAAHIAQLKAREVCDFGYDRKEFVEGYGPVGELGITAELLNLETEVTGQGQEHG